jgi:hypothetical protein
MNYMVHVSSSMWKIKNQPSNSTSCSDNALHLLVLVAGRVYWGLQVTSLFSIWCYVLKGYFERSIFWRAKSCLNGIEEFSCEHWWSVQRLADDGGGEERSGVEWRSLKLDCSVRNGFSEVRGPSIGSLATRVCELEVNVCVALLSWAPPTHFCPEDPIKNGTVVQLAIAKGFGNDSLIKTLYHFMKNFL